MSKRIQIGNQGETMAVNFLKEKGYQIVETKWRHRRAEIDIIAKDGSILVFVEVRTRSYDFFGKPESSITTRKERLIADAAFAYMEAIGYEWEIRFDVIGILWETHDRITIEHFEDAFLP